MSTTLYQPIHRNGMAGLPCDTMTGANLYILSNGGFNLWRVEMLAVAEPDAGSIAAQLPKHDRPFAPIKVPQRVLEEVRELSPSTMAEARAARLRIEAEGRTA